MSAFGSDGIGFDLPFRSRPFAAGELERIRAGLAAGRLRRYGAALHHREAGILANAMAVWRVPAASEEEFVVAVKVREEITHAYRRVTYPDWPYNYYTMIHGRDREACAAVAAELAARCRVADYKLLFSTEELKKISLDVSQL